MLRLLVGFFMASAVFGRMSMRMIIQTNGTWRKCGQIDNPVVPYEDDEAKEAACTTEKFQGMSLCRWTTKGRCRVRGRFNRRRRRAD